MVDDAHLGQTLPQTQREKSGKKQPESHPTRVDACDGRRQDARTAARIDAAEDAVYCRRVLKRLERGELPVPDVLTMLSYPAGGRASGLQSHGIAAAANGHWSSAIVG